MTSEEYFYHEASSFISFCLMNDALVACNDAKHAAKPSVSVPSDMQLIHETCDTACHCMKRRLGEILL